MLLATNRRARTGTLIFVATGLSFAANANDIHVCATCAHTSIQSAVNAAATGDVIDIAAGLYTENVTIAGKQLTLLGATGGANGITEVSAAGRGPVFTLGSGVAGDPNLLIEIHNLTISHGNHTGGTGVGGGVQVRAGAYLHLLNSIVTQNDATSAGGIGVNSPGAPQTTISGCLIDDNVANGPRPSGGPGGGVVVLQGSSVSIDQSTIARNQSTGGGGVYGARGSNLTITNTTVTGNTTHPYATPVGPNDGGGGGLETFGDFAISDSFFVSNLSQGEVGGGGIEIYVADSGPHTITRTVVSHNNLTSGVGGGIGAGGATGLSWTLDQSYVVQNLGYFGVWNASNISVVVTDTLIADNAGGDLCTQGGVGC
jgi:Right handed beta helix region